MKPGRSRPLLMGILNLTPDSFSDGGAYRDAGAALQRAEEMLTQGADIIDVGGESTRPGSARVGSDEQKARVLETIAAIAERRPRTLISIDTTLAKVAEAALDAGAGMLNDVSAGRDDPAMLELSAARKVPICLMHMRGEPGTMQDEPRYDDVVAEVLAFLVERAEAAGKRGVSESNIVLDPGLGFGKSTAHNLRIIKHLRNFVAPGYRVLLGASRKRFMESICRAEQPAARVAASCATTLLGLQAGVSIFRVHDVREHRQVMDLAAAIDACDMK